MKFIKGVVIGTTIGVVVGIAIGATNCKEIYDTVMHGKKEMKRFKRKYIRNFC